MPSLESLVGPSGKIASSEAPALDSAVNASSLSSIGGLQSLLRPPALSLLDGHPFLKIFLRCATIGSTRQASSGAHLENFRPNPPVWLAEHQMSEEIHTF